MKAPHLERVLVTTLIPYANNARTHNDNQIAQIAASITEFGWTNPVLIDPQNEIIAGHGRVLAAQQLGITEAPCIRISHLTEAQKRAYTIADNQLALNAGWDEELLAQELEAIKNLEYDMALTGFEPGELNEMFTEDDEVEHLVEGITDPDQIPESLPQTICQLGDVWLLDGHRVVCGDATCQDTVDLLMDGQRADMVFTDPPYGVSYRGTNNPNGREWDMIQGDDLRGEALYELLYGAFKQMHVHTLEHPAVYVWHSSSNHRLFETALIDAGFEIKQQLIWNKGMVLGHSDYHWAHEPCFYARKKGGKTSWVGDRKNRTILRPGSCIDLTQCEKDELIAMIEAIQNDATVWEIRKDNVQSYVHPNQKPTNLCMRALLNHTVDGAIILDPFLGSGSSIIACEQTKRLCYGLEVEPKYCDILIQRWQDFTGRQAVNAQTGEYFG